MHGAGTSHGCWISYLTRKRWLLRQFAPFTHTFPDVGGSLPAGTQQTGSRRCKFLCRPMPWCRLAYVRIFASIHCADVGMLSRNGGFTWQLHVLRQDFAKVV